MAKEQKSIFKEWWFYLGIAVFLFVIYMVWPSPAVTGLDTFATCLSESGAVMYGTEWCSHCKAQKEMFGASFKKINFVDCDRQQEVCLGNLVSGYPTWKIKGQNYPGQQSLQALSELTSCELVYDN